MTWLAGQKTTAQRLIDNTPHAISYTALTANSATTTTTEAVALTTGSVTFETGRAYRITLKCLVQSSVATDTVTVRVRKTNVSGDVYVEAPRVYTTFGGGSQATYFDNICTNTTGADITAPLALCFVRTTGTGNVLIAATSTTHVAYVLVEDIGLAADFPSARAIT